MRPDELVEHLRNKSGSVFMVADWCGGSALTFTNVILPELKKYDFEIIYFGNDIKLNAFLKQNDSLQIIWVEMPLNNPISHKKEAKEILEKLDN